MVYFFNWEQNINSLLFSQYRGKWKKYSEHTIYKYLGRETKELYGQPSC